MEKRTICLLNDSFPPKIDGVANAVVNYATEIEAHHGHAVVVTPSYPNVTDRYPFPVLRYPSVDTTKIIGYRAGYPFSPDILRRLRDEKIELLHSHCPVASTMFARSLRRELDAPIVFTYHTKFDVDIATALHSKLLQESAVRFLIQNISACDEVWVVSRGAGENLRKLGYEGAYEVMENGVDLPCGCVSEEVLEDLNKRYNLPESVPLFLFVGRMMWYKGLRIILNALAALHTKGRDFRMVFVGDGADCKEVEAYSNTLGLSEKCLFVGSLTDRERLRTWYCRADLFLFPSSYDTNGLVVREAAACSLASVLIRGSCAAEGASDGRNSFLIDENPTALTTVLEQLCDHPERMRTAGEHARDELYISWEQAVAKANERYHTIVERYRSGDRKKHQKMSDSFFHTSGELMDALSKCLNLGDNIERKFTKAKNGFTEAKENLWQKLDRYL